ncbi:hypothetical protein ACHAW6_003147 [Cyclotella cf. meneghiniana]
MPEMASKSSAGWECSVKSAMTGPWAPNLHTTSTNMNATSSFPDLPALNQLQYICLTVPGIGPRLAPVEQVLCTNFLSAILGSEGLIDDKLCTLLGMVSSEADLQSTTPSSMLPPSTEPPSMQQK